MSKKTKVMNDTTTKESLLTSLKEDVKSLIRKKDETFYDLGETLNVIKALSAHNEFSKFIEDEIDFSHNLANKYMRIASNYSKEEALLLGVRKATSLLSLDEKTRKKFLQENDITTIKCDKLDELLRELKSSKKPVNEKAKAKSFVKNIDNFKKDLSSKITLFTKYRYEIDDSLIEENKDIFDKLEELNDLINSKSIESAISSNAYNNFNNVTKSAFEYNTKETESFDFDFN